MTTFQVSRPAGQEIDIKNGGKENVKNRNYHRCDPGHAWPCLLYTSSGLPLFPFAMIGGWVINAIAQRVPLLRDLFDRKTFQRIQGMALEILVTCAMASISIPVVLAYWAPLLIGLSLIHICAVSPSAMPPAASVGPSVPSEPTEKTSAFESPSMPSAAESAIS